MRYTQQFIEGRRKKNWSKCIITHHIIFTKQINHPLPPHFNSSPWSAGESFDLHKGQVPCPWSIQMSIHSLWNTWQQFPSSLTSWLSPMRFKHTAHCPSSCLGAPDFLRRRLYSTTWSCSFMHSTKQWVGTGTGTNKGDGRWYSSE